MIEIYIILTLGINLLQYEGANDWQVSKKNKHRVCHEWKCIKCKMQVDESMSK